MKTLQLMLLTILAALPCARAQVRIERQVLTNAAKLAPDLQTASSVRMMRDLERRFAKPKKHVISSDAIDQMFPRAASLLDGANDISAMINRYRYGEQVSFLGKQRGMLLITRDIMITPPHRRNAKFVERYGLVPVRSEHLPSKVALAFRESF